MEEGGVRMVGGAKMRANVRVNIVEVSKRGRERGWDIEGFNGSTTS
jgi:hypothetical protein